MDQPNSSWNQAPLLKTKLYIPRPRPGLVPRARLLDQLSQGLGRKLTLISAPAGFGKTTLLGEWIERDKMSVAWLSLDEEDNDLARFLTYLVAALQTIEPDIGNAALAMLLPPQASPFNSVLASLLNEAAGIPDRVVLVLDDYHLVHAPAIHAAMTFLLDHLPPQLHVVLSTRVDPPLPIARLRARGELNELRQANLRFTDEESIEFLNQAMGLKLAADEITTLAARTEGWIAGLQLAAVSMKSRSDVGRFIAEFSGSQHHILDYLIEEVLQRQPEHVQAFLLRTSILQRMTGPLCDALFESQPALIGSSQAMLEHMEHQNLFVVPLDDNRGWYRYHQLFADLLRTRLQETQPALVSELHRRASAWYEAKGLIDEAIDHALSAGTFERAANLISRQAEHLWARYIPSTMSRWLESLPDELVSSWPELTIHHATVLLMAGRLDQVEQHVQMAERVLNSRSEKSAGPRDEKLRGMIAMVKAFMALFRSDPRGMAHFSQEALECLPREDSTWRGGAAMVLGDAHNFAGEVQAAIREYGQAMQICQAIGNLYYALMAAGKIATLQFQQGQLHRAAQTGQQGLQLAEVNGLEKTARAGVLMAILGQIHSEWNNLETALAYAQHGATLCEQEENVVILSYSYIGLTQVLLSRNDLEGAQEALAKLEKLAQESSLPAWIITLANGWQAFVRLKQNDLDGAAQILQKWEVLKGGEASMTHFRQDLSYARLCLAQGNAGDAIGPLEQVAHLCQVYGRGAWLIETLVVAALAHQARGDTARAVESLQRALVAAEPEGYVRTFVTEGEPMQRLLREVAGRGIETEYVLKLLNAFEMERQGAQRSTGPGVSSGQVAPAPLAEPFSDREREVLRLLATDLSSTEIAQQLFISMHTVRSHIKNIYGKLNVHSRYEAVARARELDLAKD